MRGRTNISSLSSLMKRLCTGNPTQINVFWRCNSFPELKVSTDLKQEQCLCVIDCDISPWASFLHFRDKTVGKYHLEAKHFPSDEGYFCDVCSKHLKSQNALKCHLYQRHSREERDAAKLSQTLAVVIWAGWRISEAWDSKDWPGSRTEPPFMHQIRTFSTSQGSLGADW